jgi:hypothetical protein
VKLIVTPLLSWWLWNHDCFHLNFPFWLDFHGFSIGNWSVLISIS